MRIIITILGITTHLGVLAQEHARILNQHTSYIIKTTRNVEIENSYSVLIHSEKGKEWAVFRAYSDKFSAIKDVEVIVKDMQGKRVKRLTKLDGIETGMSPSYEIDDSKWLIIDPGYQHYPYIMEVTYKLKLNGFISLPTWEPRKSFNTAVDQSILEIIVHPDQQIKVHEENIGMASEKVNGDGWRVKKYEVTALPHIDQAIRHKEFHRQQPKVYVSPFRFEFAGTKGSTGSWKEFGDWFLDINSDPYVLESATKDFLDNLDKKNVRQLVTTVYNYMQDRTRYVSIQLGIGGFKSLSTESVEANGYGDCKALTTYMKNLLDYAGVRSNYILVRAGADVPDVIEDFPGNQFNHVFLGVPLEKDTMYLECTSQVLPVDHIGTFTDDRNVLWIEKNDSKLIRSRINKPNDNYESNFANIVLDKEGNGLIELNTKNQGIFYDEIMIYKGAPENYVKEYNFKKFPYKDLTIKKFAFDEAGRNAPSFNSSFLIEVPGLGDVVNEKLILPVNLLRPVSDYINYDEFLKYADIMRGITVEDHVEVSTKDFFGPSRLPEEYKLSSKYGEYLLQVEQESGKLIIKRMIMLKKGTYTGDEFSAFMNILNEVKKYETKKIVLSSKT